MYKPKAYVSKIYLNMNVTPDTGYANSQKDGWYENQRENVGARRWMRYLYPYHAFTGSGRTYPKHEERIMFWIQDHVRTAKHIHWIKFQFLNNKVRILMSESTGQGYNIINMNNVYNLITYQMFTWLLNVINNVSIQKTDTDWSYRNYYRDIKHTIAIYRYLPR